jgi:hypothetical protein
MPFLKLKVLMAPGSSGLSFSALLPRVTRVTIWLDGVARIWCA